MIKAIFILVNNYNRSGKERSMMKNEENKKEKNPSGKLTGIAIFLIVVAIFVGPRLMREYGVPSAPTISQIEAVQDKIGHERFTRFMKATVPLGYVGMCAKKHGQTPELMQAGEEFNNRNRKKMIALIQSLEAEGGLTADEKDAIDKYAYSKVFGDIRNRHVSCDTVADRINNGEWDL